MKKHYKRLGDYIQLVDERNTGMEELSLVGLSISKQFINSVANIIGTDLSNYKIIRRSQFACSLMQVSRDEKIPIAMFTGEKSIMSPAYPIFEVRDTSTLLPQYLMMWFERPEFDRQASFYAVGGVRGNLPWEDFLELEIPIPPITKQREIVKEYNTIQNRINLNQQLIQKLEETAQAVYREWFVEFEFPDETTFLKEYVETNPKLELRKGKRSPYIEMANLSETSMCINGKVEREYQGGSRFQNKDTLLARITPCLENGKTAFVNILKEKEIAAGSTEFIVLRAKKNISSFWVYCLAKDERFRAYAISSMIGSSGRQRVHEKYLEEYQLAKIDAQKMESFHKLSKPIFESVKLKSLENQKLMKLKDLLLSKLATVEN